jgi:uncharacterized protein DUF5681
MTKDTKFKPGQSGNPKGKPRGAKDKRTAYRVLFEDESEELINKVIELAKGGDTTCLKMCIDRIVSPYRAKDQKVVLDDITGTLTEKGEKIIEAMGKGDITPSDTSSMLAALAAQARIVELDELEKRIGKLEKEKN